MDIIPMCMNLAVVESDEALWNWGSNHRVVLETHWTYYSLGPELKRHSSPAPQIPTLTSAPVTLGVSWKCCQCSTSPVTPSQSEYFLFATAHSPWQRPQVPLGKAGRKTSSIRFWQCRRASRLLPWLSACSAHAQTPCPWPNYHLLRRGPRLEVSSICSKTKKHLLSIRCSESLQRK